MSNTSTWPPPFVASAGVNSLNGEANDITLAAGAGIAISQPDGQTIQIDVVNPTNILPDGAALSGTYLGDVLVQGSATIAADVVVKGDLFLSGGLTSTEGFGLTTIGDCFVGGAFSFTPASTATTQSNVSIGGDCYFGATSDFRVNPGQNPSLNVFGELICNGDFDGSGQPEAQGMHLTASKLASFGQLNVSGGESAGTADAGNGGAITTGGSFFGSFKADGGDSAHATFNAGNSGAFLIGQNLYINDLRNISCRGGSVTVGDGNAGNGAALTTSFVSGTIYSVLDNSFPGPSVIDLSGGDAAGAGVGGSSAQYGLSFGEAKDCDIRMNGGASTLGVGGAGGSFTYNTSGPGLVMTNSSFQGKGGSGATNGGGATFSNDIPLAGNSLITGFDVSGGNGTAAGGPGGSPAFLGSPTFLGAINVAGGTGISPGVDGAATFTGGLRVGTLAVSNAAAATTLGTVTKKIELFDSATGLSLGFVPVYDAIT